MQPFPHHYLVEAAAGADGDVTLSGGKLPPLSSAPPVEFDGPGDRWSPENLLVAAVADCFVLTFRAIARMSKLPWTGLDCRVTGTVERVERTTMFTAFTVQAVLRVPAGADEAQARRLLERAKQTCLVTSSLKAEARLEADVTTAV